MGVFSSYVLRKLLQDCNKSNYSEYLLSCIYLVVVNRAWDILVWSCLRIYIYPISPIFVYLFCHYHLFFQFIPSINIFQRKAVLFLCRSSKFLFAIFLVSLQTSSLSFPIYLVMSFTLTKNHSILQCIPTSTVISCVEPYWMPLWVWVCVCVNNNNVTSWYANNEVKNTMLWLPP